MIPVANNRFLTSFGMTVPFVEREGRSGDSAEYFKAFIKYKPNRRFFPLALTNHLSFRVPLMRDEESQFQYYNF
jgi:hypothetical protein